MYGTTMYQHTSPYAHTDDAQLVPDLLPSPVPRSCAGWGAGGGAHVCGAAQELTRCAEGAKRK